MTTSSGEADELEETSGAAWSGSSFPQCVLEWVELLPHMGMHALIPVSVCLYSGCLICRSQRPH